MKVKPTKDIYDRIDRHQTIPLALKLVEWTSDINHKKYKTKAMFEWVIAEYYHCFSFCEKQGYKNVLDFGCGIGLSQYVYDLKPWSFNLELADLETSWKGAEKEIFNRVMDLLGINYLRITDITHDFKFIDQPKYTYDAVIAMRFPPLSKLLITAEEFKTKLNPYTTKGFDLIYYNLSPDAFDENIENQMFIWKKQKRKYEWDNGAAAFMVI
jgi:SAM-dependent methyltransferase